MINQDGALAMLRGRGTAHVSAGSSVHSHPQAATLTSTHLSCGDDNLLHSHHKPASSILDANTQKISSQHPIALRRHGRRKRRQPGARHQALQVRDRYAATTIPSPGKNGLILQQLTDFPAGTTSTTPNSISRAPECSQWLDGGLRTLLMLDFPRS